MNNGLCNIIFCDPLRIQKGPDIERTDIRQLPECKCFDDLYKASNGVYLTQTIRLNSFIADKFNGFGIEEFFRMYTQICFNEQFCVPISPNAIFHYWEYSDSNKLKNELQDYGSMLIDTPFGTFPNLHDTSLFNFTLIHAKFDLLEDFKKYWPGCFLSIYNFDFYIKATAQGDLTIIYQESKGLYT